MEFFWARVQVTSAGAFCAQGGRVRSRSVWNALGGAPTTLGIGNQSMLTLPYS
ncbi:hypothetical protein [Streptomyces sp.]|uniref:hypothetical protein n=1 Tax=Streptomyces sp. TaxID=1931 RepID=UPI002F3EA293